MTRRRQARGAEEGWKVGQEDHFELPSGILVHLRRAKFGWTAWICKASGEKMAPISTGNYSGASVGHALMLVQKQVSAVRGKRN